MGRYRGHMHLKKFLSALCVALSLGDRVPAHAQEATLTGHVVDSSGAAVPGASVLIRNTDTSVATDSVTNNDGLFGFPSARPGSYELTVTLSGICPIRAQAPSPRSR